MLSLTLSIASAPVPPKLSPTSHQVSPYSPAFERATLTTVLADVGNPPAGDHPPLDAICHLKTINSLITGIRRLPSWTRPPPAIDTNTGNDTENNGIANIDTPPNFAISRSSFAPPTTPCSIFPVHGPFDLLYRVQTGAFAAAWAASDQKTGRLLCLKVFEVSKDPDVWRSVQAELRVFKRIVKSERGAKGRLFIMELNRSFRHATDVYFAMELLSTDLSTYLCCEPDRCRLHARRWMAQIALGIESLHDMAIIHRDIKSENILIDSRENIRIIDFGLACLSSPRKPPNEFLGTPSYMAPEVLRNKGLPANRRVCYNKAVDWWALGCILFELESRDHQILFDQEEDLYAYITWKQKSCQQMYASFDGLDPVLVRLLEGLLQIQPSARYSLNDMEKHPYFLCSDGTTEFDNAACRALERSVLPELVPQSTEDPQQPTVVIEAAKPGTDSDWINWKWGLGGV